MLDLHGISRAAFDLIVTSEVSSEPYYNQHLRWPIKPGGASGVTIGLGYDCGYATAAKIRADWSGLLPQPMVAALVKTAGMTHETAAAAAQRLRNVVDVPWPAALEVFSKVSLPEYLAKTRAALPNFDELSPDCRGVLLSLVYNRGAGGFTLPASRDKNNRYPEMRAIRAAMKARDFDKIPGLLRKMKRLWTSASVRGVALRREAEAKLFERGLAAGRSPAAMRDPPSLPPTDPTPIADAATATRRVQMRLAAMNYNPGRIEGEWGGMLGGAIAGFINDRGLPLPAPTSAEMFEGIRPALESELTRAELEQPPFKRPVSAERASGDIAVVAERAPEIVPVRRNFLAGLWASIAAFFASIWNTISGTLEALWNFFTDHRDDIPTDAGTLESVWSFFSRVPSGVWLALAGVGFAVFAFNAWNGARAIRSAVQTGERQ